MIGRLPRRTALDESYSPQLWETRHSLKSCASAPWRWEVAFWNPSRELTLRTWMLRSPVTDAWARCGPRDY